MGYAKSSRKGLVFQAIGDPTRRAILARLGNRTLAAGELAAGFRVSRPAISKHLRVLERARLIRHTREGRHRYYRLTPAPLRDVDLWLAGYRRFWERSLTNLKTLVEKGSTRG